MKSAILSFEHTKPATANLRALGADYTVLRNALMQCRQGWRIEGRYTVYSAEGKILEAVAPNPPLFFDRLTDAVHAWFEGQQALHGDIVRWALTQNSSAPTDEPDTPETPPAVMLKNAFVAGHLTEAVLMEAMHRYQTTLDNPGFCLMCGAEADACEPDARNRTCEACGTAAVFGVQEILMILGR